MFSQKLQLSEPHATNRYMNATDVEFVYGLLSGFVSDNFQIASTTRGAFATFPILDTLETVRLLATISRVWISKHSTARRTEQSLRRQLGEVHLPIVQINNNLSTGGHHLFAERWPNTGAKPEWFDLVRGSDRHRQLSVHMQLLQRSVCGY